MSTTRGAVQDLAVADLGLQSSSWRVWGTSVRLVVADGIEPARRRVEEVLAGVDAAASRFRPDSELSRLTPGVWTEVSPLLARCLTVARDAAADTDGLVDPTVGLTLSDLGYDRTFRSVLPDGPALTVVRSPGGWESLRVEGTRVLAPPGLDLGAPAKGLAADLCAAAVGELVGDALVGLGGDLATAGSRSWPVLVTDTSDPDHPQPEVGAAAESAQVVDLVGGLATSGTAARRWTRGGRLMHHLIDPRTSLPADGPWRTVSVLADTCVGANVASTASVVLGAAAPAWLRERGYAARLVAHDGTVTRVGAWPRP